MLRLPGNYTVRVDVLAGCNPVAMDVHGWLRLQIFGCDSPAGCIPGDFNLDGRVNLEDFATFANNSQA